MLITSKTFNFINLLGSIDLFYRILYPPIIFLDLMFLFQGNLTKKISEIEASIERLVGNRQQVPLAIISKNVILEFEFHRCEFFHYVFSCAFCKPQFEISLFLYFSKCNVTESTLKNGLLFSERNLKVNNNWVPFCL